MPSFFVVPRTRARGLFRRRCRLLILVLLPLLVLSSAIPLSASDYAFAFAAEYDRAVVTAGNTSVNASSPSVSAEGAILLNGETGEIYFGKNAGKRLPMASTTKIMTALVAIEALPLDTVITVDRAAVGTEGSSVYLYAGETLTLEALLYALLLESANDAAVAIAYGVAGGVPAFADLMNEKAVSLGLTDTHFENPHGLDAEEHYTTAHDLAVITAEALKTEAFRTIVSTYKKTIPQQKTDGVRLLINHNRLLRSYEDCIGVKTGYTRRSGRCLVSAAERDGLLLVAVTLSDPNDWRDHTEMLDYGFSMYESVTLAENGRLSYSLPVFNGTSATATASYKTESGEPLAVVLPKNHGEVTCVVELPQYIWGNVAAGTTVGRVTFFCDDKAVCEVVLSLSEGVTQISYRLGIFERITAFFKKGT